MIGRCKLFAAVVFLLTTNAFGISRVGNKMIGIESAGITLTVPDSFGQIGNKSATSLRLTSVMPTIGSGIGGPFGFEFIEASDFAEVYPEFVHFDREALSQRLGNPKWSHETPYPCVDVYRAYNATAVTTLMTWGQGEGFVFANRNTGASNEAMLSMLHSFVFSIEACRWN